MAYQYLENEHLIKSALDVLCLMSHVVLDVETTGVDPHTCDLVDVQLGCRDDVLMFPARFVKLLNKVKLPRVVGHNLKYDFIVLKRHGVDLFDHDFRDTMLLHHLHNENSPHALDIVAEEFDVSADYKDDFWKKYDNYTDAPLEERINYACSDIIVTDSVYRKLREAL